MVWLEAPEDGPPILQVLIMGRGGEPITHSPKDHLSNPAAELALATRALLEEAGIATKTLTDDSGNNGESPDEKKENTAVRTTSPAASEENPTISEETPHTLPRFAIGLRGDLVGEVYGAEGVFIQAGGGATFSWLPASWIFVRAVFAIRAGPFDQPGIKIHGWSMAPGLEQGFLFQSGPIHLGPKIGIHATRQDIVIGFEQEKGTFDWWRTRATLGIEALWPASPVLGLTLNAGAGVYLGERERFVESGGAGPISFSWPYVDWEVGLGIVFFLGER